MEHDKEGGSDPPPTEQLNEDIDMNQTASSADTLEVASSSTSTDASTPASTQAVETPTAPTGLIPGIQTSQTKRSWGQGLSHDANLHVPDDSDTTLEAMTAVMNVLPCRTAEELDESVLDENADFIISRLNHHDSDVRSEWTEAMTELVQRVNAIDVTCILQNLKDIFTTTELAGIRAFSLKGAGNTMFTVPAEFMMRHLVPSMILNKSLAETLLKSPPKSGEDSQVWDNVNIASLLTSIFGDLRMRTWIQANLGLHPKADGDVDENIGMDETAESAGGSSERSSTVPKVADMRTLNVLADANRGYRILDVYNSHMTHAHEVNLTDILEEFEGIMAVAASKGGYSRSGDKDLLVTHKRRAEELGDTLKMYLDKLIAAEKSVLVVNQTNYSVILENEKLREEIISIKRLHADQLKENQHEVSLMVVAQVEIALKKMEELREVAITTIKSQRYNSDIEDLSVSDESYKQKWESEKRLSESLSQRLSSQSYATAIATERLNASNLRMSMLPLAQLNELLAHDASDSATLLREALHDQRDYTAGLKFSKGEFTKWSRAEKDKLNMQSYSRIVSPGFCISSAEQTEAKALEEVWKETKGLVYKPNPPLMVAGIDVAKKERIPKKTGFSSGGNPTAVSTYSSVTGRGSSSTSRARSPSPTKKRLRMDTMIFSGTPTFLLHYSPQKEEFMDESHSAWTTPMNTWAYPSIELPFPHPWKSEAGLQKFGRPICDLWAQAYTVMCEAHTRPENVIDECFEPASGRSTFQWLHQPMNRQPPPQIVSQLREWNLFPQTLRLPDPQDAYNRHIKTYIQNSITLSYLRVIVKPHKKYHGSDFQRPHERESIRTPGFNDKVQYKPGMWQGHAGNQHPTYPEASDLFKKSGMSKTALRRSTLPVSNIDFLHRIKNDLKHGEGRDIMYRLYMFLPACMVDIKGHLRDLHLEQRSDHLMSPWADSTLLSYSTIMDDDSKPHRITYLEIPKFLVMIFGDRFSGVTHKVACDWSQAPDNFPLEELYCRVEAWLHCAERCIMETSLRMHFAWSELHHIVYERHRNRIRVLYNAIAMSFSHIVPQHCVRTIFSPELWRDCHTRPVVTDRNPRPCSFDKVKHFILSRWTCRENGHFTRPPYNDPTAKPTTVSQQKEDAGQE